MTTAPVTTRKPGSAAGVWAGGLLLVGVLYVLSAAPMLRVSVSYSGPTGIPFGSSALPVSANDHSLWQKFYAPVVWLAERAPLRNAMLRWFGVWNVDGDFQMLLVIRDIERQIRESTPAFY